MAIAAITAAELLVGVELSHGRGRQRRVAFVEDVLASIPIEPYDLEVARTHATLLAHTRRSGRPRGAQRSSRPMAPDSLTSRGSRSASPQRETAGSRNDKKVGRVGIEPTTLGLRVPCSTS